jgi:predicted transposase/invertase (TIGR01784 family)
MRVPSAINLLQDIDEAAMKRDSIFYKIFARSPTFLFDLLPTRPADADAYQFDSVEVKETSFRIDGVFQPPDANGLAYFAEVQFQPDQLLYERMMSEGSIYFYRNRERCQDYRLVAIYPSKDLEQAIVEPHQYLIDSGKLKRIYLDELEDIESLPIGLGLMVLTILEGTEATAYGRRLVDRSPKDPSGRGILDIVSDILFYKFSDLSRDEVSKMLVSDIQDSRLYREVKEEGQQDLLLGMINYRLSLEIPEDAVRTIRQLSSPQLTALSKAMMDFRTVADLHNWLESVSTTGLNHD